MRRRTASSIAHTIPATMPPTAMCQTRISAENASAHSAAELTAMTKSCVNSNRLRFQRLAEHTSNRADEQHRQAASNRHQSDQDSRLSGLVGKDPGNQQLEPTHRVADPAGKPKA